MEQDFTRSTLTTLATYAFSVGEMPYRIDAIVILCGQDIIVVCGGGTRHHTGSVAVAISTPKLKNKAQLDVTTSTIGIPGHKEDQIARDAALKLSKILKVTTTVAVGIHIDNANPGDIKILVDNYDTLISQVIETLSNLVLS